LHLSRYIATGNSDIKITIFSGFPLHFRNIATKKEIDNEAPPFKINFFIFFYKKL